MSEPSPKVQASADLSLLAPTPVNPAAAPVIPEIQGQAAALEAMSAEAESTLPLPPTNVVMAAASAEDAAADDSSSISDAYGEEEDEEELQIIDEEEAVPEQGQNADDYAKTFDSPEATVEDAAAQDEEKDPEDSTDPSLDSASDADAASIAAQLSSTQVPDATASQPPMTTPQNHTDSSELSAPSHQEPFPNIETQNDIAGDQQASANPAAVHHGIPARPDLPMAYTGDAAPSITYNPQQLQQVPQVHSQAGTHAHQEPAKPELPAMPIAPVMTSQPSYVAAGAPGTSMEAVSSLPPPPAMTMHVPSSISAIAAPAVAPVPVTFNTNKQNDDDYQRQWEQFVNDERRYMAEARWDRFPDGSRIFIGNLSSDRVSKRDVFELFHKYGRLAQISLKSAYGFVQYHTVNDAQAAMDVLQGAEIRGRKIHLEFSRTQKKNGGDRNRSPGEKGGRDRDGGGRSRRSRDDYRPGRNNSPRRHDTQNRDEGFGRDRGFHDSHGKSRGRSRSPPPYARNEPDLYRRRSPSPYGRPKSGTDQLDIPRRYGSQVPDVQLLLLQEVPREFIAWVERAFVDVGLKTEVMFLHPSFPRAAVIERQVLEGVHAVVELDMRAHQYGKIPLETFNRSGGAKVNFDQYRDLEPPVAAQVVLRVKSQMVPPQYAQQPPAGANAYQPYNAPGPLPQQSPHAPSFPGMPPTMPGQQTSLNPVDLAGVVGQLDNNMLQRLLASIQGPGGATAGSNPYSGVMPGQGPGNQGMPQNVPVDLQTVLGNLKGSAGPASAPGAGQGAVYGANPYGHVPGASNGGAPTQMQNAQVQNIMAQLAKYRQ